MSLYVLPVSAKDAGVMDGVYHIVTTDNMALTKDGNMEQLSNAEGMKWEVSTDKKGKVTFRNMETKDVLTTSGNDVQTKKKSKKTWSVKETKSGYQIECDQQYLQTDAQVSKSKESSWKLVPASHWQGQVLSSMAGTVEGPNGKETYYNLDMSVIVSVLQERGFQGEYWEREDGAKMFGEYIMVAANYEVHPYGSIVETSMGMGIVCDTGGFAAGNPTQLDIATNW